MINIYNKLKYLLSKNQLLAIKILILLILVGMGLEAFLLYSIIPIIKLITDEKYFEIIKPKLESYSFIYETISYYNLAVIAVVGLILIFFLKNLYLIILTFSQNKFLSNLNSHLSSRLYRIFLCKKYSFFLNNNSSEILKNFQIDLGYFNSLCQNFIQLIVEVFLCLAVLITLIYLEPISSIISGLLIIISSIIYVVLTKGPIKKLGYERFKMENLNSKLILESIQGIKEIKIYNKEEVFIDIFKNREFQKAFFVSRFNTLNQIPRLIFEVVGITAIMSVVIYKINFMINKSDLFVTVGLFISATFRLLPSVNRIISALQGINYYKSSFLLIYNLFYEAEEFFFKSKKLKFKDKIELKNINFKYHGGKNVLENLSLEIKKGDFIGLMGESGTGKTTLFNIILGLLYPTKGEILIDGKPIKNNDTYKNLFGYITQDIILFDESIKYNISLEFNEKLINFERVNEVIRLSGLENYIASLENGIETIVGEKGAKTSGGQIKRIGIARALYNDPDILFFDEATSALDKKTELSFLNELLKFKGKKTIIFISHNKESLKICDKVYKLENSILYRI